MQLYICCVYVLIIFIGELMLLYVFNFCIWMFYCLQSVHNLLDVVTITIPPALGLISSFGPSPSEELLLTHCFLFSTSLQERYCFRSSGIW